LKLINNDDNEINLYKMRKLIFLIVVVSFISCEKKNDSEKEDIIKPYTGLFNFKTTKIVVSMCDGLSSTCIDGWEEICLDTSYITTNVKEYDTNKLVVQFGNDTIGKTDNDSIITQTIHPTVSLNGTFSLPNYPIGGHNSFQGYYIGLDTIIISIKYGGLIGMYNKYEVIGIRKK